MNERAAHRQLLSATKLVLNRLELRCKQSNWGKPYQPDWAVIAPALRAIHESSIILDQVNDCPTLETLPSSG